ncbi:efflux RND transporter permease subunit [bacterium BFN5]|nr:efflux RND transporter permease subunit [bacterium BFN5]
MINVFIKRPVFTTMVVMLLVVFGLNAYPSLGIDLYPDVDFPIVTVTVTYTGTSPEEMESLVTKPIEDAVSSVSGIKTLSSVSREGVSQVTLEFEFGTNPKLAANDVREKVAGVRRRLPDQIDEPVVQRYDITAQSIVQFSLASDTRSRGEIRKLAVDIVKDELQRLDGVAEVNVFGASDREIHLLADPKKLESYNISLQQILDLVNAQNMNTPGGRVNEKGTELTVRTLGKYKSVDDLKELIITNQNGRLVKLGDVVMVEDGWTEERVYAQTGGVPSVLVAVQKQSGTNTVDVADRVKKAMTAMQANVLPPDIKISTVRDSSTYIRSNVEDVMVSLIFGGILAVIITFLFLQNTRATIIGAIAIPTSIIATFFLMKAMGFTLNNMSLMGLSLAVGILIDDAIVVIENIFRHMEKGQSPKEASYEGTTEIALAVIATTLSILAVFVPVGNMGQVIGQFFKQFGLTVAFAVAFSLFVAFTLTPTLSAYWLKHNAAHAEKLGWPFGWLQKILDSWERIFLAMREFYKETLIWALKRPKKLVAIAILSLFINFLLLPFLGVEFQPSYDSGEFSIVVSAPAGTSMDKMKQLIAPVESEILAIPELETAFMTIGAQRQPVYKASIGVRLIPSGERSRNMMDIMDDLRIKFRDIRGLKIAVQSNQGVGRGDSRPIQVGIRGSELDLLTKTAHELADAIKQIPGTTDVDISSEQFEPEIQVKLNSARAGDAGVDSTTLGNTIQMAFLGMTTKNQYNIGDSDYDIRLQLIPEARLSIADVANLRVATKSGSFVRLNDIAEVKLSSGPTQIDREARQRQVIVYANAVGVSAGEVINKIKENIIPGLNLPLGYSYKFVGQAQTMQESFSEIKKALILAIVLIYMVLAAEFESFIHPFTIMLSLPFSLVGAILGLLIAGKTINIMSLIGVIMLMGLVTKNAILVVDYTNQLRAEGMSVTDALIEAGTTRLRPILMTTMAMIFGMAPIALGFGAGAELRSSMGVVLIGGLITSTALTLIIVPLVYLLIDKMKVGYQSSKSSRSING